MKLHNSNVLFTGRLLGFDKSGCVVKAHDKATCDFGIQGSTVTSFVKFHDSFDPSDNLMRRRVGRLIEIYDTVSLELIDRSLCW